MFGIQVIIVLLKCYNILGSPTLDIESYCCDFRIITLTSVYSIDCVAFKQRVFCLNDYPFYGVVVLSSLSLCQRF